LQARLEGAEADSRGHTYNTPYSDVKELLIKESSPQNALKISNHTTFMGPWGPSGAMGPMGPMGPYGPIWAHCAHEPYRLLGWGTTRRELKVPSGIAHRKRYFKESRGSAENLGIP